jgi:glycosyl transferase family 25
MEKSLSCLDYIDAILYINLEHRKDRNEHILNEIHKICKDESKIHRIDAIKKEVGPLGCSLSHIKTLNYFLEHPEWNSVLVLEDDFTFKSNDSEKINNIISVLMRSLPNYDMILLSYNDYHLKYQDTSSFFIKKVLYSQTTSSYIINKNYVNTLIKNFKESSSDMENNGLKSDNCLDVYWSKLQPNDNWYAIFPAIGYQYANYSDIENKFCNYRC